MGSPPEQITFEYYDTSKQCQKIGPISPMEFYKQIVKPVFNINNKVIIITRRKQNPLITYHFFPGMSCT